ncbi:RNA polymerase factor sigma-54 [Macromonas nakdongensis]|uniref:RNA polymerase factor sigma-54 n=1 Tax=Macromonas nakdongensis TaxID=1843082 RepID=UPI000C31F950|nr:RNA polymerase factor sigma-54 [Macromonas nakdongensis]
MKQGLSLRVSQHLALTPQLQQSIRLLQLSTLEMAQEVEQMLDDNPFLEREQEAAEREDFGLAQADAPVSLGDQVSEWAGDTPAPRERSADTPADTGDGVASAEGSEDGAPVDQNWDGDGTLDLRPDDSEWGGDAPPRHGAPDDETASAADLASEHVSLAAHLHEQALALRLNDDERAALYFLIESLNDDGYLADPLPELAEAILGQEEQARGRALFGDERLARAEELQQLLQTALHWLQHMEPAGVGARHLAECLTLQILELRNSPEARTALAICQQPLELMAKRDVKRLAALCGGSDELVKQALALIAQLEPKPGRRFANVERNVVVPDVIVTAQGRGFKVQLNPEVMPRLRVQDVYANAMRGHKGDSAQGMQQRLQEARWFIKNIQQRFDTILRVASAIVERQRSFFLHGELAMRPLVLREIADELGLHESTISRVTTAKYMATPYGTFELKYFFGSALGTETGGNASSTAVRALIKQFVGSEDSKKPLSDNQISDMLKEQGIECARRTVAKYRESLRIAPANLRKAL